MNDERKISVRQRAKNVLEKVVISLGQELYFNDFKVTENAKELANIAKTLNEIASPVSEPYIIMEDNNKCFNSNKLF